MGEMGAAEEFHKISKQNKGEKGRNVHLIAQTVYLVAPTF